MHLEKACKCRENGNARNAFQHVFMMYEWQHTVNREAEHLQALGLPICDDKALPQLITH